MKRAEIRVMMMSEYLEFCMALEFGWRHCLRYPVELHEEAEWVEVDPKNNHVRNHLLINLLM